MSENGITLAPEFKRKVESVASLILQDPNKDEIEMPGFEGGLLVLASRDGVNRTDTYHKRMNEDRLPTGPIEIDSKLFCIFT